MQSSKMLPAVAGLATLALSACAGNLSSKYTPDSAMELNKPVKDEQCYDASVLLGVDMARAKDISRKVLIALDSTLTSETDADLFAQRNRHIGVLVGSGGEELHIQLARVADTRTFMTATTKTGFVGGAGQKAWSCQMVDEAVKLATP